MNLKNENPTEFIALDVETANADFSSICQIGLALFRDGQVIDTQVTYVDPETYFDTINISIHHIDEATVAGSPTWPDVYRRIIPLLSMAHIVHHTGFDRASLTQACSRYDLPLVTQHWVDSARAARRTWSEVHDRGYGLLNLASKLQIPFNEEDHHDALKDAILAGYIMHHIIQKSGISIYDWPSHLKHKSPSDFTLSGNPEGLLAGEKIVFTGALEIPRHEAARIAALAGCDVQPGVNKETTILVVGNQDITKLAGRNKSTKHIKAEELIKKGQQIRIIAENDFLLLVQQE